MESQEQCGSPESLPVKRLQSAPDGGYGWIVLLGSFISFFIADGWSYSFGVLFPEIVVYFGESHALTSIVGTLLYAVPMIVSPFACALVATYGYRIVAIVGGFLTGVSLALATMAASVTNLCIIIGLVSGIGLAMVYVSAFFTVTVYFERRRGLATSIAVAGSGIGALAFPPLIERLSEHYTWRGTMLIAGGICLNLAVVGALFRPLSVSVQGSEDSTLVKHCDNKRAANCIKLLAFEVRSVFTSMFSRVAFRSLPFYLFLIGNFGIYLWISMPYVYMVDYAMLMDGLLPWHASLLLSLSGVGRIVGQFIFGILGDRQSISPCFLFGFGSSLAGLCTALVPVLAKSYPMLGVYASAFGLSAAVTYVLPMICLVEVLGLDQAVNAFGFLQLVQGIATLLGTPIAGWLFDTYRNYDISFRIGGIAVLLSGLTIMPVRCVMKRMRQFSS